MSKSNKGSNVDFGGVIHFAIAEAQLELELDRKGIAALVYPENHKTDKIVKPNPQLGIQRQFVFEESAAYKTLAHTYDIKVGMMKTEIIALEFLSSIPKDEERLEIKQLLIQHIGGLGKESLGGATGTPRRSTRTQVGTTPVGNKFQVFIDNLETPHGLSYGDVCECLLMCVTNHLRSDSDQIVVARTKAKLDIIASLNEKDATMVKTEMAATNVFLNQLKQYDQDAKVFEDKFKEAIKTIESVFKDTFVLTMLEPYIHIRDLAEGIKFVRSHYMVDQSACEQYIHMHLLAMKWDPNQEQFPDFHRKLFIVFRAYERACNGIKLSDTRKSGFFHGIIKRSNFPKASEYAIFVNLKQDTSCSFDEIMESFYKRYQRDVEENLHINELLKAAAILQGNTGKHAKSASESTSEESAKSSNVDNGSKKKRKNNKGDKAKFAEDKAKSEGTSAQDTKGNYDPNVRCGKCLRKGHSTEQHKGDVKCVLCDEKHWTGEHATIVKETKPVESKAKNIFTAPEVAKAAEVAGGKTEEVHSCETAVKMLPKVANDSSECVNITCACSDWSSIDFNGLPCEKSVAYEIASHSEFSDFGKVSIACLEEREMDLSDPSDSAKGSDVNSDQSNVRGDGRICKKARNNDPPSESKIYILEKESEAQTSSKVEILSEDHTRIENTVSNDEEKLKTTYSQEHVGIFKFYEEENNLYTPYKLPVQHGDTQLSVHEMESFNPITDWHVFAPLYNHYSGLLNDKEIYILSSLLGDFEMHIEEINGRFKVTNLNIVELPHIASVLKYIGDNATRINSETFDTIIGSRKIPGFKSYYEQKYCNHEFLLGFNNNTWFHDLLEEYSEINIKNCVDMVHIESTNDKIVHPKHVMSHPNNEKVELNDEETLAIRADVPHLVENNSDQALLGHKLILSQLDRSDSIAIASHIDEFSDAKIQMVTERVNLTDKSILVGGYNNTPASDYIDITHSHRGAIDKIVVEVQIDDQIDYISAIKKGIGDFNVIGYGKHQCTPQLTEDINVMQEDRLTCDAYESLSKSSKPADISSVNSMANCQTQFNSSITGDDRVQLREKFYSDQGYDYANNSDENKYHGDHNDSIIDKQIRFSDNCYWNVDVESKLITSTNWLSIDNNIDHSSPCLTVSQQAKSVRVEFSNIENKDRTISFYSCCSEDINNLYRDRYISCQPLDDDQYNLSKKSRVIGSVWSSQGLDNNQQWLQGYLPRKQRIKAPNIVKALFMGVL